MAETRHTKRGGPGGANGQNKKRRSGGVGGALSGRTKGLLAEGKVEIQGVTFSKTDCAPQLVLSKDLREVTGEKGYRMVRAIEGVVGGNWYWECEVLEPEKADAHLRLGWSQKSGDLQAPVGYDKYSYGYRDLGGSKVHMSTREDGYGEPYGPGDIIGFMICLPVLPEHIQQSHGDGEAEVTRSLPSSVPKGEGEDGAGGMDEALAAELDALRNHIRFFKNGVDQGVAFSNIPAARYYPAASLYMGARIRANFGPKWICNPVKNGCRIQFRPISDLKDPLKKEDKKAYEANIRMYHQAWRARRPQLNRGNSEGSHSQNGDLKEELAEEEEEEEDDDDDDEDNVMEDDEEDEEEEDMMEGDEEDDDMNNMDMDMDMNDTGGDEPASAMAGPQDGEEGQEHEATYEGGAEAQGQIEAETVENGVEDEDADARPDGEVVAQLQPELVEAGGGQDQEVEAADADDEAEAEEAMNAQEGPGTEAGTSSSDKEVGGEDPGQGQVPSPVIHGVDHGDN